MKVYTESDVLGVGVGVENGQIAVFDLNDGESPVSFFDGTKWDTYSYDEDDFESSGVSDFLFRCLELISSDGDEPINKLPTEIKEMLEDDIREELDSLEFSGK